MAKKSKHARKDQLTKNELSFAQHFALHGNGAEAYGHAYPKSRTNSPEYRSNKASKLLAKATIKARVDALKKKVSAIAEDKFEITAERIIQEMAAIAFANSDDYYEWGSFEQPIFNRKGDPVINELTGKQKTEIVPYAYIKPSKGLSRRQKAAIVGAEMSFSKTGDPVVSVKMADKRGALKDLAQMTGHLKNLHEVTGKNGAPIAVAATSADISKSVDPKEALKLFEAHRLALLGPGGK
jgi:hypothetical protein